MDSAYLSKGAGMRFMAFVIVTFVVGLWLADTTFNNGHATREIVKALGW